MKKTKVTIKKTSTWYTLESKYARIMVNVDEEDKTVSIGNNKLRRTRPWEQDGWEFVFKHSEPKTIKHVAELLLEASKLVKGK